MPSRRRTCVASPARTSIRSDISSCGLDRNRAGSEAAKRRMVIGIPKEIKSDEYRVAVTPAGVEMLARDGHDVIVEKGAGLGSGFTDDFYERAGATIEPSVADVWSRAELILKVKEPTPAEWPLLRRGQVVFTYFHFAAS